MVSTTAGRGCSDRTGYDSTYGNEERRAQNPCVPFPLIRPYYPAAPVLQPFRHDGRSDAPSILSSSQYPGIRNGDGCGERAPPLPPPPCSKKIVFSQPNTAILSSPPPVSSRCGMKKTPRMQLYPHTMTQYQHHHLHGGKLIISIIVVGMIVFLFFISMMIFFRRILFSYST